HRKEGFRNPGDFDASLRPSIGHSLLKASHKSGAPDIIDVDVADPGAKSAGEQAAKIARRGGCRVPSTRRFGRSWIALAPLLLFLAWMDCGVSVSRPVDAAEPPSAGCPAFLREPTFSAAIPWELASSGEPDAESDVFFEQEVWAKVGERTCLNGHSA